MSQAHTQKISITTAIIISMNAMIGAGIFSLACSLCTQVGPAGLISYLFAFVAIWCIAQSLARVAFVYPQEGSFYAYTKLWAGNTMGCLAAGSYFVGILMAMGLLCKMSGSYLQSLFPYLSAYTWGFCVLALLIIVNLFGMALSKIGQYVLIIFTILPLVIIAGMCMTKMQLTNLAPFMPHGPWAMVKMAKIVVFGFFGFECTLSLFNILENPEKSLPRTITISLLLVGLIYFLFIGSVMLAIPQTVFAEHPTITITEAMNFLFPNNIFLLHSITFCIILALVGTIHSVIWSISELLLSYSKNIRWPARVASMVTQKAMVLVVGMVILLSYIFITSYDVFFSLAAVTVMFALLTSMIPLLFLKNEWRSGQNVITVLGLLFGLIIFSIAVETLIENVIKIVS